MRLPDHIAARLAEPTSRRERSLLTCRLSIYRALRGEHQEASLQLAVLRANPSGSVDSMALILAKIADAVAALQADDVIGAGDRLRRARAMAQSVGDRETQAMAAAWIGHLQMREPRFGDLLACARAAAEQGAAEFDHVRARMALDVACALHLVDRYDLARPWYEIARRASVAQADDAMVNQLIFADAFGRLTQVRWAELQGGAARAALEHAGLSIASSFNYDRATGSQALTWRLPLMNAQFLVCTGRLGEARILFEGWLPMVSPLDDAGFGALCAADYHLCLASKGDFDRVDGYLAGLPPDDGLVMGTGVELFVLSRVARMQELAGRRAESEAAMQRCRERLAQAEVWRREFIGAYFDTIGHLPAAWGVQRPRSLHTGPGHADVHGD